MEKASSVNELAKRLEAQIIDTANRERECREFLQYVSHLLFKETPISNEYREEEYRGHSGDSDYVVSAMIRDTVGDECVRAYIWELKAPQCYLFEKDTENRVKPSSALIQAENQLLHYYDEQKGSEVFKECFDINHPDNVCLGGIIIGSKNTLVKGEYDDDKRGKLFARAKRIRERYFYNLAGIKIMTWNTVLDHLIKETSYLGASQFGRSNIKMPAPRMPEQALIVTSDLDYVRGMWPDFINTLRGYGTTGNLDAVIRASCEPVAIEGDTLVLGFYWDFHRAKVEDTKYNSIVVNKLQEYFPSIHKVRCILTPKQKLPIE